ncbi:MAG: Gfo/Idh/MocA family oxidoreductase, partial [Phycisphaerales bacterium]|nr:Gfo/Idh/MocA family oxidoreductase [Phycisphaerales bacterium]
PEPLPASTPLNGTIRIGVIGCGGRGTGAIVQALSADPNVKLVAMGDVFKDRLDSCYRAINEELSDRAAACIDVPPSRRFVGLDSFHQVLACDIDAILITGYPAFRPEHLKAAVAAGKHIFAEKPLAVDATGIRTVKAAAAEARAKGLTLVVGFCWRYNPGMREAFKHVNDGGLGRIVTVHTNYHTSTLSKRPRRPEWTDTEFQLRNWWHFTWLSGDHIVEQSIHSIDRLMWATGDRLPEKVICLGGCAARTGPESGNSFDHFAALYHYADGTRAYHTARQIDGCPSDNSDYIYGTNAWCEVNGWKPTYLTRDYDGKVLWEHKRPVQADINTSIRNDEDMYQVEHNEFFAAMRSGRPINDGERAANACLMGIMARMAAYTGQTVTWQQALESKESLVPANLKMGAMEMPKLAIPGKTKLI